MACERFCNKGGWLRQCIEQAKSTVPRLGDSPTLQAWTHPYKAHGRAANIRPIQPVYGVLWHCKPAACHTPPTQTYSPRSQPPDPGARALGFQLLGKLFAFPMVIAASLLNRFLAGADPRGMVSTRGHSSLPNTPKQPDVRFSLIGNHGLRSNRPTLRKNSQIHCSRRGFPTQILRSISH